MFASSSPSSSRQAKRVSEALDLFGEMLEAGVKPNAIAVNSVLAACARDAGDFWMHAKAIFEVCSVPFRYICKLYGCRKHSVALRSLRARVLCVVLQTEQCQLNAF